MVVINSIRREWSIPWEISNLIDDAVQDAKKLDTFSANHCYREANQATNLLANWGKIHQPWLFSAVFPPGLSLIIRKDELGFPTIMV